MDETTEISPDEARMNLLWYLADCIWYFFGDPDATEEEAEGELEVCQGIALAIAESTEMRIIKVVNENELVVSFKLADDAQEAVQKFISGG